MSEVSKRILSTKGAIGLWKGFTIDVVSSLLASTIIIAGNFIQNYERRSALKAFILGIGLFSLREFLLYPL